MHLNPWLASAAIGASIPIYEGGALRAQVKIATAQQAQAVARYGSVVLKAFREVENALANEQLLAKRLPLDQKCRRGPHRGRTHRHRAVQGGTQRPLWVSHLQTGQLANEADLIKLTSLQRVNRVQLYLALGGSFDQAPAATVPADRLTCVPGCLWAWIECRQLSLHRPVNSSRRNQELP